MRPVLQVVHRSRSGQSRQATPKVAMRVRLSCATCPAGRVTGLSLLMGGSVIDGESPLTRGLQRLGLDQRKPRRGSRRAGPRCRGRVAVPGEAVIAAVIAAVLAACGAAICMLAVRTVAVAASSPGGQELFRHRGVGVPGPRKPRSASHR